jgi:hypothetical protein
MIQVMVFSPQELVPEVRNEHLFSFLIYVYTYGKYLNLFPKDIYYYNEIVGYRNL